MSTETTDRTYTIDTPLGERTVDFAVWEVVDQLDEAARLIAGATMDLVVLLPSNVSDEAMHVLRDYARARGLVEGARGIVSNIEPSTEDDA